MTDPVVTECCRPESKCQSRGRRRLRRAAPVQPLVPHWPGDLHRSQIESCASSLGGSIVQRLLRGCVLQDMDQAKHAQDQSDHQDSAYTIGAWQDESTGRSHDRCEIDCQHRPFLKAEVDQAMGEVAFVTFKRTSPSRRRIQMTETIS